MTLNPSHMVMCILIAVWGCLGIYVSAQSLCLFCSEIENKKHSATGGMKAVVEQINSYYVLERKVILGRVPNGTLVPI